MKQLVRKALLSGLLSMALLPFAEAAKNDPSIGCVYPAGGKQGTTFEVTLSGSDLEEATHVYFSGTGVQAKVIEQNPPGNYSKNHWTGVKYRALMRDQLPQMSSAEQSMAQANLRELDIASARYHRRLQYPPLREWVILQVTIAADATPGERELRLETFKGLSNPRVFCVGSLPEISKPALAFSRRDTKFDNDRPVPPPEPEMSLTLPVVVNGQIPAGDVHRFRFTAKQGQHLLIAASARELIPYLADGVPGWFQANLTLYDAQGRELTYASHYRFHPDPVIFFDVPSNGDYVVELRDSLYRGREDFVYRLTVGELPYVTSIFPLGGPANVPTTVKLNGWNLPASSLPLNNRCPPGILPAGLQQGPEYFNTMPFAVDTLPECLSTGSNHTPATAQTVILPVIVNGRIEQPNEWSVFRFEGQAGQKIVAEVMARRLNSPLDSVIKLTDASDRQVAFNDDFTDKSLGKSFEQVDSYVRTTLSAAGTYYLHLSDAQRHGGPEYAYRLRLSAPRPDFALRVAPSSINAVPGAQVPITVYAFRHDGFTNAIQLALKNMPPGFALNGNGIPALPDLGTNLNQVVTNLTLTVPNQPTAVPVNLDMEGSASIQGRQVVRPGDPAEEMMQAFFYWHVVPVQELKVAVTTRQRSQKIVSVLPIRLPLGGTARVRVKTVLDQLTCKIWGYPLTFAQAREKDMHSSTNYGALFVQILDPTEAFADTNTLATVEGKKKYKAAIAEKKEMEGISVTKYMLTGEGVDFVVQSDAARTRPDLKGNLNLVIKSYNFDSITLHPIEFFPPIPFEIVGKSP